MNKIILNKIVFLLASVVAAATFTTEASALPLFARQTGMECAACHFQHFPMLTAFGRSFKSGAYTMVGAQEKVEGDSLSIPAVLNAAVLSTAGYSKTNQTGVAPATAATGERGNGDGTFYVPGSNGEFSLFIGGRTSDFSGALAEVGLVGPAPAGVTSAKIPMLWEVTSGTRAGIVPFTTNGQCASYGFETLNTGANAIHTMLFVGGDFAGMVGPALSAQQYIGTGAAATGFAGVVNNESYFVNVTKYSQMGPNDFAGGGIKMSSTYLRAAYLFDLAGFDSAVGVQNWSGSSGAGNTPGAPAVQGSIVLTETKGSAIDGQMQGSLGGMPVGFYAEYANAPAGTATLANAYNASTTASRSSFNFSTELGVIPEKATINFGMRRGKSGVAMAGSNNATDNAFLVGASYKLRQNIMVNFYYVAQSGDYWNTANTNATGSKETIINLATIF
jgi:hypothetical protein